MTNIYDILLPFEFQFQGASFNLSFNLESKYESGNYKVVLYYKKGEKAKFPFATISTDVKGSEIGMDEFVVNLAPLYKELIDYLEKEKNYFIDTGKKVMTQYGLSPVWKINYGF